MAVKLKLHNYLLVIHFLVLDWPSNVFDFWYATNLKDMEGPIALERLVWTFIPVCISIFRLVHAFVASAFCFFFINSFYFTKDKHEHAPIYISQHHKYKHDKVSSAHS